MANNEKNFYDILGLTEDDKKLPEDEFNKKIRSVYREESKKHHPDKWSTASEEDKKYHEEKFKEINEAYETLSDAQKRQQYDLKDSGFNGFDPFGINPFNPFGVGRAQQRVFRGQDVQVTVEYTLSESINGATKTVKYQIARACTHCKIEMCPTCKGTGMETQISHTPLGHIMQQSTCTTCGGTGYYRNGHCDKCGNKGYTVETVEQEVMVPVGVFDGAMLRLEGCGSEPYNVGGKGYKQRGDLFVVFKEIADKRFERDGDNLTTTIQVNLLEAWCGCDKEIETIEGNKIKFKIPQLTKCGQLFKFKGRGMINPRTGLKGDMFVKIDYECPEKPLTKQQVKVLKEFYEK